MNPLIAWIGLAAVALPIIIHIIMRRRRRPMSWGAMRFVEEALRRQRRRTRLEQLLLLATRCLIVALIAIALGRPLFGDPASLAKSAPRTLYIVIDDSLTSDLRNAETRAFDRHITSAMESIDALSAARGDSVAIVTLARPSQAPVLPPTSDLNAAKRVLAGLTCKDSRADLASALELIATDRKESTNRFNIEMFSEFRAGSFDRTLAAPRTNALRYADISISPVATDRPGNIRMRAIRVLQPPILRGSDRLSVPVRISAFRDERDSPMSADRTSVKLAMAGINRPTEVLSESSIELVWTDGQSESSATGFLQVDSQKLADVGDLIVSASTSKDSLERDNSIRTATRAFKRVEVAIIAPGSDASDDPSRYSPAQWLSLSLAPSTEESERRRSESDLRVTIIDPSRSSQPAALAKASAIVVPAPDKIDLAGWELISAAARSGVFVLVMPPNEPTSNAWGDALAQTGWSISIAGEVRNHQPALKLATTPAGSDSESPLGLLGAEIEELIKPVSVFRSVAISGGSHSIDSLLSLSDGSPFLVVARRADESDGTITLFASAPDTAWTDLPAKPLMLPLIQELIRQGVGTGGTHRFSVAGERPKFPAGAVELREVTGTRVFSTSDESPTIHDAGVFMARDSAGAGIEISIVNPAYAAGDSEPNSATSVADWIRATGAQVSNSTSAELTPSPPAHDSGWSVTLLAITVLLAAIETFIARSFSHATMERSS